MPHHGGQIGTVAVRGVSSDGAHPPERAVESLFKVRPARPGDAQGMARVHVDSWRTTYHGIVPDAALATLSYSTRQLLWAGMSNNAEKDHHFIFVAEDESGQIVGFADGGPEREGDPEYKGELYAIYLLKEYQGRGLGRLLAAAVAKSNLQAGYDSMLVWVLAANPAWNFYQHLGGQEVKVKQIEIGGTKLDEIAYGWKDLTPLIRSAT